MNDVEMPLSTLPDDIDYTTGRDSFGEDGNGCWYIIRVVDPYSSDAHIWRLPDCINKIINNVMIQGGNDVRNQIQSILQIKKNLI